MELKEPLPKEEQEQLLRIAKEDKGAKDKLIEHNLRLVMWVAKQYYHQGFTELEDLFQWGVIGLMDAIDHYDPERKGFATIAVWLIRNSINRSRFEFSQDIPLDKGFGEGEDASIHETIPSKDPDVEDVVTANEFIKEFKSHFKDRLTPVQYETILMMYGLKDRVYSLSETAKHLGFSSTTITKSRKDALNKIKRSMFIKDLRSAVDDNTKFINITDYSNTRVQGGSRCSPVERIVMAREEWLENELRKYDLDM
jgi:RNA polymerase sporulation-specific sigma factor